MAKAILLAEDSPDDELLFKHVLKNSRMENPVVVVRDGLGAIAYLEGTGAFADRTKHPSPAILILDLKLPRVDGFAVLEWLQKMPRLKKELFIVVLTHLYDHNQIRRAYALGADSFLCKPLTEKDLNNLIRHFDSRSKHGEVKRPSLMNDRSRHDQTGGRPSIHP